MKNNAFKHIGFITIIALIIISLTSCGGEADGIAGDNNTSATATPAIAYSVAKKDESAAQITYRLTINDRSDKPALIEVLRKLKKENNDWKEKLVCFFYIQAFSESGAWASCAYLPECDDCGTDKDADGNPVEFRLLGVSKALADSLQNLRFDSISNKQLLVSYIEDVYKCKSQLFKIDNDDSKVLHVQLFNGGGYLLDWLKVKTVDGEKRYYFDDEEPAKENYLILNEAEKTIHFKNYEDSEWMAYGYTTN